MNPTIKYILLALLLSACSPAVRTGDMECYQSRDNGNWLCYMSTEQYAAMVRGWMTTVER